MTAPRPPLPPLRPLDEALAELLSHARPLADVEAVSTFDADGRVLAQDLVSALQVPPQDNSSMDGYALRCADLAGPSPVLPVSQRIAAGAGGMPLAAGSAARIFTGAPIPAGADAVVMQEDCELLPAEGDELPAIRLHTLPKPGRWIRRAGEDVRRGAVVLARGALLTPASLGLAASIGLDRLQVARRPRVALFSTGDELVLTSGGVSVGEEDHIKPAVQALGRLDLWQIAIKPGKPFAYGRVQDAHFIGLPGNPVSSFVTFLLLVRPFLLKLQGVSQLAPETIALPAHFTWPKADKRQEFLRARRNQAGGLDLFENQSSGVLTSAVWGDGLVNNPSGQTIAHGDLVRFVPFSELLT